MPDTDLSYRGRAHEDEYFRQKDKELIEKLKKDAARRAERQKMAEQIGVDADNAVIDDLQGLGLTADTVKLLHLVPFVAVAWASGDVDKKEKELIIEAARAHGVDASNAAYPALMRWLNQKPAEGLLQKGLEVAAAIAGSRPVEGGSARGILDFSLRVAEASGGLFGIAKVSADERKLLEKIAATLEKANPEAAKQVSEASGA
jgi:tellurite resistance protein